MRLWPRKKKTDLDEKNPKVILEVDREGNLLISYNLPSSRIQSENIITANKLALLLYLINTGKAMSFFYDSLQRLDDEFVKDTTVAMLEKTDLKRLMDDKKPMIMPTEVV